MCGFRTNGGILSSLTAPRREKLERWGNHILVRPDPQAVWNTPRRDPRWKAFDGMYIRSEAGGGAWDKRSLPESWQIGYGDLRFNVRPMNFKHTGVFPEQAANWDYVMRTIRKAERPISVLNLFAYTGAATAAALLAGASVCHVDAARGMVSWAKENASASGSPINPSAGLWTTAQNSSNAKSGGAGATTP